MKNSKHFVYMATLSLVLGLGACGKKTTTSSTSNFKSDPEPTTRVDTNSSGGHTNPGGNNNGGGNNGGNQLLPTCFNYMDHFTLDSLNSFFYPGYNSSNPPIPNANGDLTFCFEYRDTPSVLGNLRLEYHYTTASQPSVLKVVRFTTKLFKDSNGAVLTDSAAINARLYYAFADASSVSLIWMDNAGFMGMNATLVSGANFNGKVNFVNMPGDDDVDDGSGTLTAAHLANSADEEKCLNGTWSADQCVSAKIFGKAFYEKGRHNSSETSQRRARVVAMVKKLLLNSHPAAFTTFEMKSMLLGDSMNVNLDDAKAYTLTE